MFHTVSMISLIVMIAVFAALAGLALRFGADSVGVPRGRRAASLYALEAESPDSVSLQGRLERELMAARLYEPEKRPFWTHVTVARVRSERGTPGNRRRRGRPMRVEAAPARLPAELLEPFSAVRIALYRSTLRPTGAEYALLAGLDLPPSRASARLDEGD